MRLPARLVLLFASLLPAHIHCKDVFGIVGENFTFPVKITRKIVEIIWTKNKNKVAEWEGQNTTTYFPSLRNRGLLNEENGCLTIFNLEKSDSGTYVLEYLDSVKNNLTFTLTVLAPPSEPEISCNISGDGLVLKCTAGFEKPLDYSWKFSSIRSTAQTQEVFIPKLSVDASEKAACFIKYSQTEKSSEISLTQCFPDKKGIHYHKRSRGGLIGAFVVFIAVVAILAWLYRRGRGKRVIGGAGQENSPVCDSGERELLCSENNQDQANSDRATSSQADENEKPQAEELNEEDSTLKDKQTVKNGVNREELSTEQNITLMSNCAVDHGVTEGEVTQDAEGENEEHPSNSPSYSKEDLKS